MEALLEPLSSDCPHTGEEVQTHAYMTEHEFKRLKGEVAFFCSVCGNAHLVDREQLRIRPTNRSFQEEGPSTDLDSE